MALNSGMELGMQYHFDWQPSKATTNQSSCKQCECIQKLQLMLAPPSNLLSNAIKFACINACSFKDVLTSMSSDYMCHHTRQY